MTKLEHDEDDLKAAKEYFLSHVAFSTDDENAWMRVKKIAQQMYLAGLHARSRPEPGWAEINKVRSCYQDLIIKYEELKERVTLTEGEERNIAYLKNKPLTLNEGVLLAIIDRITSSRGNG